MDEEEYNVELRLALTEQVLSFLPRTTPEELHELVQVVLRMKLHRMRAQQIKDEQEKEKA